MTGTAERWPGELWSVYRLGVVTIPAHRPMQRSRSSRPGLCNVRGAMDRGGSVGGSVGTYQRRPVLIGTRSRCGIRSGWVDCLDCRVAASGAQCRDKTAETEIVAQAGESRRQITVATNMAGRSTDPPGRRVAERGGLHVLATERHDAGRVDRQLFRTLWSPGDPGRTGVLLSLGMTWWLRMRPSSGDGIAAGALRWGL